MKSRLIIISMCSVLLFAVVYNVGNILYQEHAEAPASALSTDLSPSIPIERGVFTRSAEALAYQQMPEGNRSLTTYYNNRAYPGAPPSIPHPLVSEKGIGGKTCLQCHQNGGYVDQFKAFAPVTPHPEWLNCKQCHVPQKTGQLFKSTGWDKIEAPNIHQTAMPGSPPVIPHALEMRDNCLSCHAGSAAPKEIRVSHPERVNCRQCHVPKNIQNMFTKPPPKEEGFTRPGHSSSQSSHLEKSEVSQISDWIHKKNKGVGNK